MNIKVLFRSLDVAISIIALSSLFLLLNATGAYAESNAIDNVTVTVPVACSITSTVNTEHAATVDLGTYEDEIGETTFNVFCNDANGFVVYAIGYSDDTYGNTTMKPSVLPATSGIVTGTATSGDTSNWAMKLTAVSGDYSPTLATGFNSYHAIPAEYTEVASFTSSTDATTGSSFKSTYAAYISQAQPADTYTGKVKYTIVHPANETAPVAPLTMQNLSSASCTTTPSRVVDIRDGHEYAIQRLLDGNCWMMENLDLGRTDLTTDLTSANTNIATTVTASTFNSWKKTSGTSALNNGEFISVEGEESAAGTLYNYYALTGGTISGDVMSSDAIYDICPAGWGLPSGGSDGKFAILYSYYNSNTLMRASIADGGAAFVLTGRFGNGGISNATNGYYWSSTRSSDTLTKFISIIGTSGVAPNNGIGRGYGMAARCILKDPIMQEVSSWGSSIQEGEEIIAKDARDGKIYTVARLADGNLWMTQNLDLDIDSTKTYTPADTDIPANWTPSASTHATNDTTWTGSTTAPESYDPGDLYWNGTPDTTGVWNDYWDNGGENPASTFTSSTGNSHNHLGNYYNWTAAVAMNDSSSYTTRDTLVDQSICPAGWTLPRAGYGDDTFYALVNEYDTWDSSSSTLQNETELWTSPTYFSLSGYRDGSFEDVGYGGAFWSPVVYGSGSTYYMALNSDGDVYPGIIGGVGRSHGYSVRCVVRPVASTVTFTEP